MTLTKNFRTRRTSLTGLSSLAALAVLSAAYPTLNAPATGQPSGGKKTPRGTASQESAARLEDAPITAEIAALWKSPSPEFSAAFARLGEEPREQSIDKLRKFVSGGQGGIFGINIGGGDSQMEKLCASYALARLLSRSKNPTSDDDKKDALALFEKASSVTCLHMISLWHMSEIISSAGDENATRTVLNRIASDPLAESSDKSRALYEMAQSYMRTGQSPAPDSTGQAAAGTALSADAQQARSIFLSIKEKYPSSEYAKGACYYLAQLAQTEAGAPTAEGAAYLKEYVKWTTNGRFSGEVADKLVALSQTQPGGAPPVVTLTPADLEQIGAIYFKNGSLTKALSIYDKLGPDAKLLQRAQCYAKLGRKADAVAAVLAAVKQDPASSSYDDYAASVCVPLTKEEATGLWRNILALNPKHADHALYNIATRVEENEALPLLAKLLNQFPTSEHAPESLWWVFWYQCKPIYPGGVANQKEKVAALIKLAEEGTARYPRHRVAARLAFWAGKLYEKLGQTEAAKKEYELAVAKWPTNYYSARARARLHYLAAPPDKRHDRGFAVSASRTLCPTEWHWPQPPHLFSFDRVAPLVGPLPMILAVTRQCDECLTKLDALPASRTDAPANRPIFDSLRAWLYLSQSMPMEGIRAAGRDLEGHPTKAPRWQILYPWAFAASINEAARKNNVDPYLVHALIREESRYYPNALSRSNAIGLMQLLPGTAYGVAKRIGLPLSGKDDIFVPENNIKMGTNYLAYTLSRFDGHAMLAVASYNGGPNAVKRWADQFHAKGQTDWDIFVENIPFRETRDYVRKVFGSYWTYEMIYQ